MQQLPLFDPPLDPGMLVQAAAAGIDIGSIVSGLNQPLGPVRSPLLIQKALEIAAEVRALGSGLLAALEKGDAEQLALLRQGHEIQLQQMVAERALPAMAARAGDDQRAAEDPGGRARALHLLPAPAGPGPGHRPPFPTPSPRTGAS